MDLEKVRNQVLALQKRGYTDSQVKQFVEGKGFSMDEISTGFVNAGGAPAGMRAAAGLKMTPQGKANYLRETLGPENVVQTRSGDIGFRQSQAEPFQMFDEPGVSMKDFADLSGDALQVAPAVGAGLLTLNPAAAAGGGLLGNLARQGVSGLLPGSDQMSMGDRALSAGIDTALAGASQYGANKLFGTSAAMGLADKARPHNIFANRLNNANTQAGRNVQEGLAAERVVGEPLTKGQLTGSRTQLGLEGLARRAPFSDDIVNRKDLAQAEAVKNRFEQTINQLGGDFGSEQAGAMASRAYDRAVQSLRNTRSAQARTDFGQVDALSGGAPVMGLNNTVKALDDLIAEFDVPALKNDTTQKTIKWLMREREKIAGTPQMPDPTKLPGPPQPRLAMTGKQFQGVLSQWGKAAAGKARVIPDLQDANTDKYIASRLFGALNDDLDAAATGGGMAENVAQALQTARGNWKAHSQKLDEITNTALGRMLGGKIEPTPEAIAEKFSTLKPSQIRQIMPVLEQSDPLAANAIRANYLGRMLERSMAPMERATPGADAILSPNRLGTQVGKIGERARLRELVGGRVADEIDQIMQYASRIADRAGTEGSPTARLQMLAEAARSGMSAVFVTPAAALATIMTIGAPVKIARNMLNPQARQAMLTLKRSPRWTNNATAAASYLAALSAKDGEQSPEQQPEQIQQ